MTKEALRALIYESQKSIEGHALLFRFLDAKHRTILGCAFDMLEQDDAVLEKFLARVQAALKGVEECELL